jgi:hypothetical protein
MFMPFHLSKTYIKNLSIFFISFSPSHLQGNADDNHDRRAHIWFLYACGDVSFAKLLFFPSWFAKLLEFALVIF